LLIEINLQGDGIFKGDFLEGVDNLLEGDDLQDGVDTLFGDDHPKLRRNPLETGFAKGLC
jgi:hypothetical protein